ncbi:MAG: type II RES/Xre toxin-antitoxin system antitoxin [Candidatus Rokuibacteriota bacterium]
MTTERIVESLGGQRALRRAPADMEALKERLRRGLPFAALAAVMRRYELSPDEVAKILALPARTLARRRVEQRLRADESDRLFRVSRIAVLAEATLGTRERAVQWLRRPHRALRNQRPLRQLDTELGSRQVEDILVRAAHGVYS